MSGKIVSIRALEILDSRGNPTLRAYVSLDNGVTTAIKEQAIYGCMFNHLKEMRAAAAALVLTCNEDMGYPSGFAPNVPPRVGAQSVCKPPLENYGVYW